MKLRDSRARTGLALAAAIAAGTLLTALPRAAGAEPAPPPGALSSPAASGSPGLVATTTTLSAGVTAAFIDSTVTLTATVVPAPGGGNVTFTSRSCGGSEPAVDVGEPAVDPASGTASVSVAKGKGVECFAAGFGGFAGYLGSASSTAAVAGMGTGTATQTSLALSSPTVEAGIATTVSATVTPARLTEVQFTTISDELGLSFTNAKTGVAVGSIRIGTPGTYQIWATSIGGGGLAGAQSMPVSLVVTPDAGVHPVDTGVSASVFYPTKDGYRDTVEIKGTLLDRARVSIAIYSVATKKKVRSVELGQQLDQYSWSWNGRSNSGSLQPAGKYRVVQSFKDAAGHTATATAYTTISPKRLHYVTKTDTMLGRQGVVAQGSPDDFDAFVKGDHLVAYNFADAPGVPPTGKLLMVGYLFDVPSEAVDTLKFEVYTTCPLDRFGASVAIGRAGGGLPESPRQTGLREGWTRVTEDAEGHVLASNRVAGLVYLSVWPPGQSVEIWKVRMTYTYGVLK